jgi:pimeloyl-ACP methyl ester carboxylesterase
LLKILSYAVLIVLLALVALAAIAWWSLRAPDLPAEQLETEFQTPHERYVEVSPGLRLHYRDEGPADAPVLLLLHGYGDSYATWEGWSPVLRDKWRVISLDLPGHGLTAAPAGFVLDGGAFTAIVLGFADKIGVKRFAVAGNSMGGGVAWKLALAAPERVQALVLVSAAGWPSDATGASPSLAFRLLQYKWGRDLLASIDNRPLIKQGLTAQVHDKALITDAVIDRWARYQRYPGHRDILMSASPASHATATKDLLATVKVPTLVLHGDYDPLIPVEHSRRFAAAIPGAKLIVYPNVGHLPQREIPEQSAKDVGAFLAGKQ